VETYHRFGFPAVVWGSVLPAVTYGHDYKEIHRVNGTMIDGDKAAAKLMRGLGYKRWAIIHDTTDYGKGHLEYFSKPLKENGGEILGVFGVPVDQQDFAAELTQVKALNPQVIYFGGLTPLGVRIRSQMDKLGVEAQFQGTGGILSDAYISALGPVAEGTVAYEFGAPIERLPGGKKFLELYKAQNYSDPPEILGPYAFVAANLIMDAIEKVGPDRKRVIEQLNGTKNYDSIIGPVTFDDHRQNLILQNTMYVVQDGKWVVWEESEYHSGKRKLKAR
jgi:branched-chain amino acid transport system substrate-binding protein